MRIFSVVRKWRRLRQAVNPLAFDVLLAMLVAVASLGIGIGAQGLLRADSTTIQPIAVAQPTAAPQRRPARGAVPAGAIEATTPCVVLTELIAALMAQNAELIALLEVQSSTRSETIPPLPSPTPLVTSTPRLTPTFTQESTDATSASRTPTFTPSPSPSPSTSNDGAEAPAQPAHTRAAYAADTGTAADAEPPPFSDELATAPIRLSLPQTSWLWITTRSARGGC